MQSKDFPLIHQRHFLEKQQDAIIGGFVQTTETKKSRRSIFPREGVSHVYASARIFEKYSVRTQLSWMLVPLAFILAGFAAMFIDWPVGHWCVDKNCPSSIEYFLFAFEPLGNGLGVALIGITIYCLDPSRRWVLPRVLACAYLAGLAANGMKMLVERTRPHSFDFHSGILTTFGCWFPGISAGSTGQSFPSGHTTTVVALAFALVWAYPKGRLLFPTMAFLVACQRIESRAHFPSDVLWGAALGSFIALCFLKIGKLPGWMDALEGKMRG